MRRRLVMLVASVSSLAVVVFAYYPAHQPAGNVFRGRTSGEWEWEIAHWEVSRPRCTTGGSCLWVWHRPSAFARICEYLGVRCRPDSSSLPLVEGDAAAIPVLLELFRSRDPKARRIAIEGIRRIGEPGRIAVPLLIEALEDSDWDVSFDAATTLSRWDEARMHRWLDNFLKK